MKHDILLIVSRYDEDVEWVAQTGLPAVVYDKSGTPGPHALPNIGREAHTYLHHILSRYPDFAEYNVFLQGRPFDHMKPGAGPGDLAREIGRLADRGARFKGLADYAIKCDRLGRPHHLKDESSRGKWPGFGRDIPVGETYARLFAGPVPEKYHVRAPAGLLFVSREMILARPRALYRAAMDLVLADPDDERNTGHAMERLWYIVFNGYAKLNKESYTRD